MSPKRVLDPTWRAAWRRTWLAFRPWNQHSLVLTTLGIIYFALGVLWAASPSSPTASSRRAQLVVLLHISDGSMLPWALCWVVVGTAAILSARWPPRSSRWGYVALGMLTGFWAAISLIGWLVYATPWYIGIGGALVWSGFTTLVWGISGLTAPIPAPPAPEGPPPDGG